MNLLIRNLMYIREVIIIQLDNLSKAITKDKIQSCVIYKDESIVFEYYRNRKIKEKEQKVYSVTKSIMSALCGIAIHQGYIESENVAISEYFTDIEDSKKKITIRHLLMMSSGLRWTGNEAMIPTKNWVKFVLDQPVESEPGKEMKYSCGNSQLLSAILQKATKMNTVTFAKKHLFGPLGIEDFHWNNDAQGVAIGGYGLTMKIEDMLKFGRLYMNRGKWNKKQIIPQKWIEESTTAKINPQFEESSYGYHWWVSNNPSKTYYALGMKGQYIIINEETRLLTVITSNMDGDISRPMEYFNNFILS
ncbi:CubicO group peptidase, beta-lactamase class C family [Paenibacillus sp. CF095]|uniref:serine hydrolase domain-containing protein n=1 Tax=Paenibacillus sp. CF095 TaxID=1881033 RepID=UPI000889FF09|nr:serine hydrolase [Paenibacillus sp. CF095]SDD51058.1 CubicO group peptidase, beta-lactamase class C family [Paenibacillus sp. CF095]